MYGTEPDFHRCVRDDLPRALSISHPETTSRAGNSCDMSDDNCELHYQVANDVTVELIMLGALNCQLSSHPDASYIRWGNEI